MIKCGVKWLIITSLTAGFAAAAQAEDLDIGKSEFQSSCASCHGTDAKGKGPVSDQLKIPPPDLTMLAKNNNGVFPTNAVYETIDGLKTIPAHGTREMPIWGERFNPIINLPHYVDPSYWKMAGPEQSPEVVVRKRILAVIDYLIVFSKSSNRRASDYLTPGRALFNASWPRSADALPHSAVARSSRALGGVGGHGVISYSAIGTTGRLPSRGLAQY